MSINSGVSWCDSAVNPVIGCDGCELWNKHIKTCYAGIMTNRYAGQSGWPNSFDQPKPFPGRMAETLKWKPLQGIDRPNKPWLNKLPRMIFLSDMGDALSNSVPFEFLYQEIILTVKKSPHVYMWLTKRPTRMTDFAEYVKALGDDWPKNLWPGVSVTCQETVSRIYRLKIPDVEFFVSAEPLLGEVDLGLEPPTRRQQEMKINLVICGGESGSEARGCNMAWIEKIIRHCGLMNIPCFVKQMGVVPFEVIGDGGARKIWQFKDVAEWPPTFRIRQFPKIRHLAESQQKEIALEV